MSLLPSRSSVSNGSLSDKQYGALLNFGVGSLNGPSDDEDENERWADEDTNCVVFKIDASNVDQRLIVAADELHRAYVKDNTQKGLILTQGSGLHDIPELRRIMLLPAHENYYKWNSEWIPQTRAIGDDNIWKETSSITRQPPNGKNVQIAVTRVRSLEIRGNEMLPFRLQYLGRRKNDFRMVVKKGGIIPKRESLVLIKGLGEKFGEVLGLVNASFPDSCTLSISMEHIQTAETDIFHADRAPQQERVEGRVSHTLDKSQVLYHLYITEIRDEMRNPENDNYVPHPRVPDHRGPHVRQRSGSYGNEYERGRRDSGGHNPRRSNPRGRSAGELSNPFLNMNVDPERFRSAETEADEQLYALHEDLKKWIVVSFRPELAKQSIRTLIKKFGPAAFSDALNQASAFSENKRATSSVPDEYGLAANLKKMSHLSDHPHYRPVLEHIADGKNWIFRLPSTSNRVATFLEITRLFLEAHQTERCLVVVTTNFQADELESAIAELQQLHRLNALRPFRLIGGREYLRINPRRPIEKHNFFITTPGLIEQYFMLRQWSIKDFKIIIWDHCHLMRGYFVGNCVMQRYRNLPSNIRRSIRVYGFTSAPPEEDGNRCDLMKSYRYNLCVQLQNCYTVFDDGHSVDPPPSSFHKKY